MDYMQEAIKQAYISLAEGGIPIGAVLVMNKTIIARGHNQRIQKGSPILHAEMDCINNAGRLRKIDYQRCTLYSTLTPCGMCAATIDLYKIPKIVVLEAEYDPEYNHDFDFEVMTDAKYEGVFTKFISANSELWKEDIGE